MPAKGKWLPFEEARAHVRGVGLKSKTEWLEWTKSKERHPKIPTEPWLIYKDDGWMGMGNWLGTGNKRYGDWLPFAEARAWVQAQGIKDSRAWEALCKEE